MQKCVHCDKKSIPGLKRGQGLCQYHWNVSAYGKQWADKVRADKAQADKKDMVK